MKILNILLRIKKRRKNVFKMILRKKEYYEKIMKILKKILHIIKIMIMIILNK